MAASGLWIAAASPAPAARPAAARAPTSILFFQFDKSGKLLKSFGAGLFVSPHKLSVDKDGNLWLADNGGNQVFKLSPEGKILLTLGQKGVAGTGLDQFDAPTDVAVAPNGDVFVADGHNGGGTATGNARIMKFDKNGKFLKTWGTKGMGPGEFDLFVRNVTPIYP
jgi:DNA-binding beta-propeller fold protein YncE